MAQHWAHKYAKEVRMAVVCSLVAAAGISVVLLSPPSLSAQTDTLVFRVPLSQFIEVADSTDKNNELNWTTDGCSVPVLESSGRTFDFLKACRRHDFAYRNFGKIDGGKRWTSSLRARVDAVFLKDMRADCQPRPSVIRKTCRTWAQTYYTFVRTYGGP